MTKEELESLRTIAIETGNIDTKGYRVIKSHLECIAENEKLIARIEKFVIACKATISCLKDWINSTGFGEINRRDKNALNLIEQVLAELEAT